MTRTRPRHAGRRAGARGARRGAAAKTAFTIRGAGFGHGVGMSQYGAMGYAPHGWTAAQILGALLHRDRRSGTTDPAGEGARAAAVEETRVRAASRGARQAGSRRLDPARDLHASSARGLTQVDAASADAAGGWRRSRRRCRSRAPSGARRAAAGANGTYRGVLEFKPTARSSGLVGDQRRRRSRTTCRASSRAESPASWPAEALRRRRSRRAPTRSRPPRATASTTTPTRARRSTAASRSSARRPTRRSPRRAAQVVTYQGKPVVTYFFSTSGGRTENVENTPLGTEPRPWLQSVDDPYDDVSPRHRWTDAADAWRRPASKLGGLVQGPFGASGCSARRLAADHGRRGRRLARAHARSTARRCAPSSGSSTRGRTSRRSAASGAAPTALRRRAEAAAAVRDGRAARRSACLRGTVIGAARRARHRAGAPRRRVGRRSARVRDPARRRLRVAAARAAPTASWSAGAAGPPVARC